MGKTLAVNRKARHEYAIEDTLEAGLALTGTEIKSIRAGKVNLQDAYARVEKGEAWLVGAHIAPWPGGNRFNHEPRRDRKLLLHRVQIDQLEGRVKAKGLTLVPLSIYLDDRGRRQGRAGRSRAASSCTTGGATSPSATLAGTWSARWLTSSAVAERRRRWPGTEQAFECYTHGPGDAWSRQGLNPGEREPRCRQASLNRRQNEVTGNRQPALALAA